MKYHGPHAWPELGSIFLCKFNSVYPVKLIMYWHMRLEKKIYEIQASIFNASSRKTAEFGRFIKWTVKT